MPSYITASKLKTGFGSEVCFILNTLADLVLKAKSISLKAPAFPKKKENAVKAEVADDLEEEVGSVHLDDEENDVLGTDETENIAQKILETDIDAKEWEEEC